MHGWHCYIFKTYPPDKLSKLRTTGPWAPPNYCSNWCAFYVINQYFNMTVLFPFLLQMNHKTDEGLNEVSDVDRAVLLYNKAVYCFYVSLY